MSESRTTLPPIFSYISKVIQPGLKVNPHHSEVEPASYAWFESYDVPAQTVKLFRDCKLNLTVSLGFPDVDASRLRNLMDISCWWFYFQGIAAGEGLNNPEEMKAAIDEIMRTVNDPSASSSNLPLAAMVQSCYQRMVQDAKPIVMQRFIAGLGEFLLAGYRQKFDRSSIPRVKESIELRRDTLGKNLWVAMLQYADDCDLPDEVANHQFFQEFANIAADLFNLFEDIYSLVGYLLL